MPYNPAQKLNIQVDAWIDGAWLTITSRTRAAGGLQIKHARSDGSIQAETSTCQLTLGNDDSWLTEGNPMSPWYGKFQRGTKIRVAIVGVLVSAAMRFAGEIEDMAAEYPGGSSSAMRITATGTLGVAAQNDDPVGSPLFRSTIGTTPGDFVPVAYWPLEDAAGSGVFASALPGIGATVPSGTVSFASQSDLAASEPLPSLAADASVVFPVATYTSTGVWAAQLLVKVPSEPASGTTVATIATGGEGLIVRYELSVSPGPPQQVILRGYDSANTLQTVAQVLLDGSGPGNPAAADFYGHWWSLRVAEKVSGGNIISYLGMAGTDGTGAFVTGSSAAGAHSTIRTATVAAVTATDGIAFGHFAAFTDAAFSVSTDLLANAGAVSAWDGEAAHDRVERLCREEGLASSITGTTSALMGPQRSGTLYNLLLDCERADQGMLSDRLDDIGIAYRTRADLYNQAAQVVITHGALTKDLHPTWDNQRVTNDVTLSRDGGSSARVSDEDHVTQSRRRLKTTPRANLADDAMLPSHAGFRLAIGTAPGPRYAQGGINLRNSHGALLADSVLGLVPGDRLTAAATALPVQHPPGGLDQMVLGWTEELDAFKWLLYPVMVPYSPYKIGIYGTDVALSRYGSAHSTLAAGATATATTLSVATAAGHALWRTGSGLSSYWDIEGIRVKVTAVSGGSSPQTVTVVRNLDGYDKALSSGAQVRTWDPAKYGL